MRVSFDLDDTLICQPPSPAEPSLPLRQRWFAPEPLRSGTVSLIRDLRVRGCSVWIYTTSFRPAGSIRRWMWAHDAAVDGVVNQVRHDRVVGRQGLSKYPPVFGIDLHVDDLPGVATEGRRHGFATLIVTPADLDWCTTVLAAVALQIGATAAEDEQLGSSTLERTPSATPSDHRNQAGQLIASAPWLAYGSPGG